MTTTETPPPPPRRPFFHDLRESLAGAAEREMADPSAATQKATNDAAAAYFHRWAELRMQSEHAAPRAAPLAGGGGMNPTLFTIRLASGQVWTGNVHGAGGPLSVNGRQRIEHAIRRAAAGRPFIGIYEPCPGHVRGYKHTALADEAETTLDLRGATLLSVYEGKAVAHG